jgi:DNA helicase HerA-like ATPase
MLILYVIGTLFVSAIGLNLLLKRKEVHISIKPKTNAVGNEQQEGEVLLGDCGNSKFYVDKNDFNRFCFILGATGSGKTVTIKRIFKSFSEANFPIIYVDGKPSDEIVEYLSKYSNEKFIGFNCHNQFAYNFLCGTPTELTDKIMCLKDEWENDYYKGLAKNILQLAIKFLQSKNGEMTLKNIVQHIDLDYLEEQIRKTKSPLISELRIFANVKKADLMGMYSHLSFFVNSDFGNSFDTVNNPSFSLEQIISENKCVYFAIPALQYPEFASSVGKIVVNDIKNTIYRMKKKVLIVLDEYSVFAGEQSLNLINQGREFGSHLIVAMQSLTDLPFPAESLLTNANMLIAHRVNSDESAETLAGYFGTVKSVQLTSKISSRNIDSFEGSMRSTREFKVHPDDIKTLERGEAVVSIKDKRIIEKVKILNV